MIKELEERNNKLNLLNKLIDNYYKEICRQLRNSQRNNTTEQTNKEGQNITPNQSGRN